MKKASLCSVQGLLRDVPDARGGVPGGGSRGDVPRGREGAHSLEANRSCSEVSDGRESVRNEESALSRF